jgi:hypothetical protein
MDLLTRLRGEVPAEVSPRAKQSFDAAFAAERSAAPRQATPASPRWWRDSPSRRALPRLALAAGLAAAVTAGIVVAVPHSPATHPATAAAPLTVRELAYRAAAAALTAPSVPPGQWMYQKGENSTTCPTGVPEIPANSGKPYVSCVTSFRDDLWQTADGTREAHYDGGRLVIEDTPNPPGGITYAEALKLPASPQALVKYVYGRALQANAGMPIDHWLATFYELDSLLSVFVLPPAVAAEVFRAMPYVPGVIVKKGAGYVAIGWGQRNGTLGIILDPSTYTVTGFTTNGLPRKGDQVMSIPLVPVSGPGVRP